ncbi:unnamed protein product, partial [Owenia fusiformis]
MMSLKLFKTIAIAVILVNLTKAKKNINNIKEDVDKLRSLTSATVELANVTNWLNEGTRNNIILITPTKLQQIQEVIHAARGVGLSIRAGGATHSASAVLHPDEGDIFLVMTSLEDTSRDRIIFNEKAKTVNVLASVMLLELNEFMEQHQVALPANAAFATVTVAGLAATAAHGGFYTEPSVSSYVTGMTLIDGQGYVRHVNQDEQADILAACKAHIGLCGIVYDVTLKVVSMEIMESIQVSIPMKKFLDDEIRKDLVTNYHQLQISWNPFLGHATDDDKEYFQTHGRAPDGWTSEDDLVGFILSKKLPVNDSEDALNKEAHEYNVTLADGSNYVGTAQYKTLPDSLIAIP